MYMDSSRSHIHLTHSHQVLYMEEWIQEKIPFDDIDTKNLFDSLDFPEDEDEDDVNLPINNVAFGTLKHTKLKEQAWNDLMMYEFLNEKSELHKIKDRTILKKVNTAPSFDDLIRSDKSHRNVEDDSSLINETRDITFSSNSSMNDSAVINTPELIRTKQNQRNFQTPIGRIVR